jgi:hypothetical protein
MVVALKTLWARKLRLSVGLALSVVVAIAITFQIPRLFPPNLASRQHGAWAANSQILVDAPVSEEGDLTEPTAPAISRAAVYGSLMTSSDVIAQISKTSHIPADMIGVVGPIGTTGQRLGRAAMVPPGPSGGYMITVNTDIELPTIQIQAQAPTQAGAMALATGADQGLINYVAGIENEQAIPSGKRVIVSQLGTPTVAPVTSGIAPVFVVPIFVLLFGAWCFSVLLGVSFVRTWRTTPIDDLLLPSAAYTPVEPAELPAPASWSSSTGRASFTLAAPDVADLDEHRLGREGEQTTADVADVDDHLDDDTTSETAQGRRFKVRGAKRR